MDAILKKNETWGSLLSAHLSNKSAYTSFFLDCLWSREKQRRQKNCKQLENARTKGDCFDVSNVPPKRESLLWGLRFDYSLISLADFLSVFRCYAGGQSKQIFNSIIPESFLTLTLWPKSPRALAMRLLSNLEDLK